MIEKTEQYLNTNYGVFSFFTYGILFPALYNYVFSTKL